MKIRFIIILILSFSLSIASTLTVIAQDSEFQIRVGKDFGYNMGGTIQGRFTISLIGDEKAIERVIFYIDDEILQSVETEPYKYQFQTDGFEPGIHRLYAEVTLKDGSTKTTSFAQYKFLSREEANRQIRTLFIGIGSVIVGSLLLVALIQNLIIKKRGKSPHQPGMTRNYGFMGGTICKKCGRPFPRHIWGINLVVGRLDRCDNCSKWSMTVRATPKALRLAEEAEYEEAVTDEQKLEGEKGKKDLLDETRYFDDI